MKDLGELDQARISPFERTNRDRYWLRGRLNQDLSNGVITRMDADLVSDLDYLREFERTMSESRSGPTSRQISGGPGGTLFIFQEIGLKVSRDSENYSLQGSGYYYQMLTATRATQPISPGRSLLSRLPTRLLRLPVYFILLPIIYTHAMRALKDTT